LGLVLIVPKTGCSFPLLDFLYPLSLCIKVKDTPAGSSDALYSSDISFSILPLSSSIIEWSLATVYLPVSCDEPLIILIANRDPAVSLPYYCS
jgi:hypothetical protein